MTYKQTIITESYQYVGDVQNEQVRGKGVMVFNDGSFYIGYFDNQFQGVCARFCANPGVQKKGCDVNANMKSDKVDQFDYIEFGKQQTNNSKQIIILDSNQQLVQHYNNGIYGDGCSSNKQLQLHVIVTSSYMFVGQLDKGQMQNGTLVFNDGSVYNGQFSKNRFHGDGQFHFNNGNIISECKFKDGNVKSGKRNVSQPVDLKINTIVKQNGITVGQNIDEKVTSENWNEIGGCSWKKLQQYLQDYFVNIQGKNKSISFTTSVKQTHVVTFDNQIIKLKQILREQNQLQNISTSEINPDKDAQILQLLQDLKYYSNQADEYQKKLFQAQDEISQLKQNAKQSQGSQLTRIQQKCDQLQKELKDKEKQNEQLRQQNINQQKESKNILEISENQNKELKKFVDDLKSQYKILEEENAQLIEVQQKQNERHKNNVQVLEQEINMLHKSSDAEQEKQCLIKEQQVKDYEYEKQQLVQQYIDEINKQLSEHQLDKQQLQNERDKEQNHMKQTFEEEKQKLVQSHNQMLNQAKNEFDKQLSQNKKQCESQISALKQENNNKIQQYEQLKVQQRIHTDKIQELQAIVQQLQHNINQFEDQKAIYLNVVLNKELNSQKIKTIVQLLNQQNALNVLLSLTLQKVDPSYCAPRPLEIDQMQEEIQANKQKLAQEKEINYYETISEEFKVEHKRFITEFKFNEKLELQLPEQMDHNCKELK
ncbi:obscurin-like_isoform X4 [Hexamita inflata]|uniref:Obscurin-like isoform X4 n=1 Tax=Hexamita inflata TaxID=28002 RepID=A0AA86V180_9EUKA|nr:obscurin-like isoform X4 [Hexamita inflata]